MEKQDFLEQLSAEIASIREDHPGYSNDGQAFTHWVLRTILLLADSEAKTANTDGPGDGGLDGFHVSDEEGVVYLVQCKYTDAYGLDELRSFASLPKRMESPDRIVDESKAIYRESDRLKKCLENMYSVSLLFVHIGTASPEHSDQLRDALRAQYPQAEEERFTSEIVGWKQLRNKYLAIGPFASPPPESKDLVYMESGVLLHESESLRVASVMVGGRELADFGNSPEMFAANFRYFLDLRNPVNSRISQTIQQATERHAVLAYNNGVTIVCDSFDIRDNERTIHLRRPQIVNGCQTVSVLNRHDVHRYASDVAFLVRIVATDEEELKTKIATFTNSQTRVDSRSLRANDPVQRSLQLQFKNWSPSYFFDVKDGEWSVLSENDKNPFKMPREGGARRSKYRRFTNQEAARSYLAFNGYPTEAKSETKSIWDITDAGRYRDVFPNNRKACELLLPTLLALKFRALTENKQRELRNNTPADSSTLSDNKLRADVLDHADLVLIAAAGHVFSTAGFDVSSNERVSEFLSKVDEHATEIFSKCEVAVWYEVKRDSLDAQEHGELFSIRNALLKKTTFQKVKDKINEKVEDIGLDTYLEGCGLL